MASKAAKYGSNGVQVELAEGRPGKYSKVQVLTTKKYQKAVSEKG